MRPQLTLVNVSEVAPGTPLCSWCNIAISLIDPSWAVHLPRPGIVVGDNPVYDARIRIFFSTAPLPDYIFAFSSPCGILASDVRGDGGSRSIHPAQIISISDDFSISTNI